MWLIEDRLAAGVGGVGFDGGFDGGFDFPLMSLMIPQPTAPSARAARQQRERKRFLGGIVSQNSDHFAELERWDARVLPGAFLRGEWIQCERWIACRFSGLPEDGFC